MKLIKDVFARIWALWTLVIFLITMIIFIIPILLFCLTVPDPLATNRFIAIARTWMGIFLPLIGCPLRINGRNNFQQGQQYVVICNHNALMDVPVSYPSIPGGNKTIAKAEMAKIPVFGIIYKLGSVLVDRKNEQSRKESFQKMKKVLNSGLHMCIYPEGTRNKTNEPLKGFHDGAFKLSIDTGKAIIPGVIFNTRIVNPANKFFYLMPHRLRIDFLAPIAPLPGDTVESLKTRCWQTMEAAIRRG
ncbi:lysophospholipid acyltransferase family protein [Flavihumibacter petaseus]|uniref:Putative acyltransferase n=1 Tax=Flavihumibacter petaseus NBRC 106054 TaxID=1220578 RepID=A0A0E9N773_9BACT|nr:lysophospholipid acyltransferase family protein [Flavihumibacter petaseus]GAO45679.1 putative acyltransferase [Flavihumibacter petaseus NBRC 106054]